MAAPSRSFAHVIEITKGCANPHRERPHRHLTIVAK